MPNCFDVGDHKYPEIVNTLTLTGPTCDPSARNFVQQAYRLYIDGFGEPERFTSPVDR